MRILIGGLLVGVFVLCVLFLLQPPTEVDVVVTATPGPTATVTIDASCTDEGQGWWYCG